MGNGGYQGPDPWEIEQAVERGYRRARGEYIPPGRNPNFNPKTCCCLVPAILFALFILNGILAPLTFKLGWWGP